MTTTIYKSNYQTNYTVLSNDFITSHLPPAAFKVLTYLLSRPKYWKKNNHHLAKELNLTLYAIKKALRQIREYGYAIYTRFKDGRTLWRFYDKPIPQFTPTNPVLKPQVEIPQVAFQPVLENKEIIIIKKQLPAPTNPELQKEVVVYDENVELKYPEQLKQEQLKACKAIIKKVKQPELKQDVLTALAYAISANRVKSAPAYLNGLITAANNGTFTPIQAIEATNYNQASIASTQKKLEQLRGYKRTPPPNGWKLSLSRI